MRIKLFMLCVAASVVVACAGDDLQQQVIEGTPEVLADLMPTAFSSAKQEQGMLPAAQTAKEHTALIKADGYDPRDSNSYYKFTSAPTDVSHLPGEFESVQALLMAWPGGASDMRSLFVDIITAASNAISTVVVYVESSSAANTLYSDLYYSGADLDNVHFAKLSLDTIWMRDYGPLVVTTKSGGWRIIDLRYYYGRWSDDVVPTLLANAWKVPVSRPPIDGEGGNFQSDGAGRCITTQAMVNNNYAYGLDADDVRSIFKSYLGCQTTVILPTLYGEGTGHVDMYVTITAKGEAIVGQYSTSDDSTNAKVVDKAASMLKSAGFKITRIPMPYNGDGNFRSYTNSLAVGNSVLVPVYTDDKRYESKALGVFKQAYPGRKIVPIDSTKVIKWAGAVHCVTMTIGS